MEWFTIRDGRIQCRWGARDSAAQARQVGLVLSADGQPYASASRAR